MNDVVTAKRLLDSGADVNARDEKQGEHNETVLILAVQFANVHMAHLLLKRGADIEAKDCYQRTALFHARVPSEIFDVLLDNGADLQVKDHDGKNKLISMIPSAPSLEAVKELINRGVNPNEKDDDGNTALSEAKALGLVTITHLLEELAAKD